MDYILKPRSGAIIIIGLAQRRPMKIKRNDSATKWRTQKHWVSVAPPNENYDQCIKGLKDRNQKHWVSEARPNEKWKR